MRPILLALAALFSSGVHAEEPVPWPAPEICARNADWADDAPDETAREFEEAFREFDWRFAGFSERFARAFHTEGQVPDASEMAVLSASMEDVYRALARLLPLREAGNEAWPMKFVLEEIPGGVSLPDFDPPDREEVLRAAFLRELVTVPLPGPERSKVRFLARLEMTGWLEDIKDDSGISEGTIGALHILASGALDEAYEADFRRPALRVLDHGWHTSLANRLRSQVQRMCEEAEQ